MYRLTLPCPRTVTAVAFAVHPVDSAHPKPFAGSSAPPSATFTEIRKRFSANGSVKNKNTTPNSRPSYAC